MIDIKLHNDNCSCSACSHNQTYKSNPKTYTLEESGKKVNCVGDHIIKPLEPRKLGPDGYVCEDHWPRDLS